MYLHAVTEYVLQNTSSHVIFFDVTSYWYVCVQDLSKSLSWLMHLCVFCYKMHIVTLSTTPYIISQIVAITMLTVHEKTNIRLEMVHLTTHDNAQLKVIVTTCE